MGLTDSYAVFLYVFIYISLMGFTHRATTWGHQPLCGLVHRGT